MEAHNYHHIIYCLSFILNHDRYLYCNNLPANINFFCVQELQPSETGGFAGDYVEFMARFTDIWTESFTIC